MFAFFSTEQKTNKTYQRPSSSSSWDTPLSPTPDASSRSVPFPERERTPSTGAAKKGRDSLMHSQFVDAPEEEEYTVAEVNIADKLDMDKPASVITVANPITPSEQQSPAVQDEQRKFSDIEPAPDESKNTLVIKNLPFKFKQADLDKILSEFCAKPKNVRLLRDDSGRFTGIAFVRCPSKDEAAKLIHSMNGLDVGGRAIQVEFKKKKSKKKQLQQKLQTSGSVLSSSGESDRFSMDDNDDLSSSGILTPSRKLAFSDETMNSAPLVPEPSFQNTALPIPEHVHQKKLSQSAEHPLQSRRLQRQASEPNSLSYFQVSPQQQLQYKGFGPLNQQPQKSMPQQTPQNYGSTTFQLFQQQSLLPLQQQQSFGMPSAQPFQPPPQSQPQHLAHLHHLNQQLQRRKSMSVLEGRNFVPQGVQSSVIQPSIYPGSTAGIRRSSDESLNEAYSSAQVRPLMSSDTANAKFAHSIKPVRQPIGPDGRSNGFSLDYQLARRAVLSETNY